MRHILIFFFIFFSINIYTQITTKDSIKTEFFLYDGDTIHMPLIELDELILGKEDIQSKEDLKAYLILKRRVLKVYPFAKAASENLILLNKNTQKLKTEKEKRKYFKIVENYLENTFESQLKKLSRKEGQILVKLIHRQTGKSTFSLIKELKSGWKAFWSNNTAKLFDINLKVEYNPYLVNEDYLIEDILNNAFKIGRLEKQNPYTQYDLDAIESIWLEKKESKKANR